MKIVQCTHDKHKINKLCACPRPSPPLAPKRLARCRADAT